MKSHSSIYLISDCPIFDIDALPIFESFSKRNSSHLYSNLFFNHKENLISLTNSHNLVYCFDEKDKDFLPKEFNDSEASLIFGKTENKSEIIKSLSDKYFSLASKNLFVSSNSIGISKSDIQRAFNLLSVDDDTVVIGRTNNNKAAFIGFNNFNQELFLNIDWNNCNYDYLLANINRHENFVHVLGNFLSINNLEDFKRLYTELSKKDSLNYCSPKMHEEFTNLFIEYKELLK